MGESSSKLPQAYSIAQEIDWTARWAEVDLHVELPFWLMTDNATITIELNGHTFPVVISGETFELHGGDEVSDSKRNVVYKGPLKKKKELSQRLQRGLKQNPNTNVLWRKCKTVLRIKSRCNEDVLNRYWAILSDAQDERPAIQRALELYFDQLCRAHIPVANKLIQAYRLATYDYFPFEVAPWDVPIWYIQHGGESERCILVPYRGWDHRPMTLDANGSVTFCKFIETSQLEIALLHQCTSGEFELLDALNLMERGDYSGAVRRVCTAIEVVVASAVTREIERAHDKTAAEDFLQKTKTKFPDRVKHYEMLSGRPFKQSGALKDIRDTRNQIVHLGYRINSAERGRAQRLIDTGRWIFNWFENEEQRCKVREERIGLRSLGRETAYGVFRSEIIADGVVLWP